MYVFALKSFRLFILCTCRFVHRFLGVVARLWSMTYIFWYSFEKLRSCSSLQNIKNTKWSFCCHKGRYIHCWHFSRGEKKKIQTKRLCLSVIFLDPIYSGDFCIKYYTWNIPTIHCSVLSNDVSIILAINYWSDIFSHEILKIKNCRKNKFFTAKD